MLNAYLIAFGGLLLLAGRLGDLVGRRRVFLVGLWVFVAASALCGLAQSQTLLVAARFVQGLGGALTSAVILGMVVTLFPEPRLQARAIGAYAAVGAVGASAGLVAGGILTQAISWHWIFFVNVPVGLATAFAATRLLPQSQGLGLRAGADLPGAALAVAALMLGVDAIIETDAARGAIAVALTAAFVARERTAAAPLVSLRIFAIRSVAIANAAQVLLIAGAFGQQFLVALYLKNVKDLGPIAIGLTTLPIALVIGTVALQLSGRVMQRIGARATLLVGLGLSALSFALLARLPAHATYAIDLLPSFVVMGLGFGLASPALTTLAMRDVDPQDAGLASGLVNTTQQIGAALGLAVLATIATSRTDHLATQATGQTTAEALTAGYRLAFAVAAAFALLALALVAVPQRAVDRSTPG